MQCVYRPADWPRFAGFSNNGGGEIRIFEAGSESIVFMIACITLRPFLAPQASHSSYRMRCGPSRRSNKATSSWAPVLPEEPRRNRRGLAQCRSAGTPSVGSRRADRTAAANTPEGIRGRARNPPPRPAGSLPCLLAPRLHVQRILRHHHVISKAAAALLIKRPTHVSPGVTTAAPCDHLGNL